MTTTSDLRWAAAIPQFTEDGTFDPGAMRAYLALVADLGFESAWTIEHVLGAHPVLGTLETLAYAAAANDALRLGCAVLVSPLHNPVPLAKSIATIDQLSRGRLEVGLGVGGGFRPFAAFGLTGDRLVARFNEGLRLMRAAWTDELVRFDGDFWQVDGLAVEPKPFQKPHPPIWFGGGHPDALRRAARHADGFFGAGSTTTERFAEQVVTVRAALADAGRDPGSYRIAKRVYLAVDDDVDAARDVVARGLESLYGEFGLGDMTPVAVYGPPETCIAGLQAVVDAGARLVLLNPFADEAAQIDRLATDVLPHVTG